LKDHPQGIGYGAATHEDFLKYARRIQPKLNHLHNNVVQIALELGWAGLGIWLYWMGKSFWIFLSGYRRTRGSDTEAAAVFLGVLAAFCGLMVNGLVEYNFGDSEILMVIGLLMGLASVAWSSPGVVPSGAEA